MIAINDDVVLSDAQQDTLHKIEHGYGNGADPEATVEYVYADEDDIDSRQPSNLWVVLVRGIKWDNERVMWTMDIHGELTIH